MSSRHRHHHHLIIIFFFFFLSLLCSLSVSCVVCPPRTCRCIMF